MTVSRIPIRDLKTGDRVQWGRLWEGYQRFYRMRLSSQITEHTFARLIDASPQCRGLVAERDGELLGLAHIIFHPSTSALTDVCYLEDLFVASEQRGAGIGRSLIQAVYAAADAADAGAVYWSTQEFNADARALYDTLARRTSFIRYER